MILTLVGGDGGARKERLQNQARLIQCQLIHRYTRINKIEILDNYTIIFETQTTVSFMP